MTSEKIKDRINEICTHFLFEYNGKDGCVDPFSHIEFDLCYGDNEITVTSIDEVMTTPFIDGKCLNEVFDKIEITEW